MGQSPNSRKLLEKIWQTGVTRVSGYDAVKKAVLGSDNFKPTHIVAVGKAASTMARAALDHYDKSLPTLIVTKYDHGEDALSNYKNVTLIESAHPVPDENCIKAGGALIDFVSALDSETKLLMLASGGASSLAEKLSPPNTLDDLKALNEDMLASGMDIHAMNTERKKISLIKNGKLLAMFKGKALRSFLISDVEGDEINAIGSGIGAVTQNRVCEDVQQNIIASNEIARTQCAKSAFENDLDVIVNEETLYGDVFEIAAQCASKVKFGPKGLYIFGGEPVILLPENPGEGGRNQALAVAMARDVADMNGVEILVAGTDGSDGPTGSAGGYVSSESWTENEGGTAALDAADSGNWLRHLKDNKYQNGGLFITGPTGTNVMDIMLVLKS
ncbi:MAG: DUF4147 domain-containing protein [Rhizobiales bacterium]|nr:DUF4147 domain-containing protein [Hyphomicrobiales bacterium]